jgi:hypothetical protein
MVRKIIQSSIQGTDKGLLPEDTAGTAEKFYNY